MNDRSLPADGRWQLVVLVAVAIAVASLVPAGGGSTLGPLGLVGLDKWLHGLGYATLTLALGSALTGRSRPLALAFALAVGVGLSIEGAQAALPYRTGSPIDALANAVGAAVAVGGLWLTRALAANS